jgi:phosphoribosylformylglycinamidine cyclo-ligase
MSLYQKRGVSAQKEDVHAAIRQLSQGLFPHAFCKLYRDSLGNDPAYVNVIHADGAGTKSILAYLYWKETGDMSVWKGIARDAVVMNLDDLICTGIYDRIVFSSTIDRNKLLIPGEVLDAIISGNREIFEELSVYGIGIDYLGGETADVGDVVRTIAVNGTMCARWPKDKLITNERISPGDLIVGFDSYGQSVYETAYNSGIGSNGLTSARHDLLNKTYCSFNESFDPNIPSEVAYTGPYLLSDKVSFGANEHIVGQLLLSPTRTYAPLIKDILENHFDSVHGMVHCSGGGQSKCLKYLPSPMRVVKDNLPAVPPVFELIRKCSGANDEEMYRVFNMGCRMEVFCDEKNSESLLAAANRLGIGARITGRVEKSEEKQVEIRTPSGTVVYRD